MHHTTIINWLKELEKLWLDFDSTETNPQVGELDELERFVCSKKTCLCLLTAVDHFKPGILGWVLGDRSGKIFEPLWILLNQCNCYFYVTDCWKID
ncbi:hypothetical protein [Microcoleus sp. F4-D5]|uniref:hypothetical protein n=1 Tax=Microcoleus sp. F4-D5 TaxID=2818760 RepID=UPI004040AFC5